MDDDIKDLMDSAADALGFGDDVSPFQKALLSIGGNEPDFDAGFGLIQAGADNVIGETHGPSVVLGALTGAIALADADIGSRSKVAMQAILGAAVALSLHGVQNNASREALLPLLNAINDDILSEIGDSDEFRSMLTNAIADKAH